MEAQPSSFPSWIEEYLHAVNSQLLRLYSDGIPLRAPVIEALSTKGKRVRAILALLWCEALCGDYKRALPVAVAYELAHSAALVQDDIIDGSEKRRGQKSIVSKYGIPNAILTSNMLLFEVPKMLAEYGSSDVSSATLCRLFDMLGESYRDATAGEFRDLEMAKSDNLSEADYEEMIKLKTGALIGASSASGAIIGSDAINEKIVEAAYSFGELLGMAYQVQDDLLDLVGEEEMIGKPAFTDIKSGKRNLVLIHTMKYCSKDEEEFIRGLFWNDSYRRDQIERARMLFSKYGSLEHAHRASQQYVARAKETLFVLGESRQGNTSSNCLTISRLEIIDGYLILSKIYSMS